MEPFRPLVDQVVRRLVDRGILALEPAAKQALTALMGFDLESTNGTSPLAVTIQRAALSLAQSFEENSLLLDLPAPPSPLHLSGILPKASGCG